MNEHCTPAVDPPAACPGVVDEALFQFLVNLEVEQATRLQYCLSVVYLTPDLLEDPPDAGLTRRLAEAAARRCRAADVVTTHSRAAIGLLLIDAEPRDLPEIVRRTTAELAAGVLESTEGVERVTWSAGGSCYPLTTTDRTELVRQAGALMRRARQDGGDRLYLPEPPPI